MTRALVVLAAILVGGQRMAAAEGESAGAASPPDEPGAVSDTDARVAVAAALGARLFKLGRYDEAVAEYRRAYELRADPGFLYHIGECYRELGVSDQALFYYERFLAAAPDAPERDEVLDKITEIEGPSARARAQAALTLAPAPAAAPTPVWRRWWVWTGIAALVAGGLTAALLARSSSTSVPPSDLGDKRFY